MISDNSPLYTDDAIRLLTSDHEKVEVPAHLADKAT